MKYKFLIEANVENVESSDFDLDQAEEEGIGWVTFEDNQKMFIHLLNAFGAKITILEESKLPKINNWTCPGFETVGYGCFVY